MSAVNISPIAELKWTFNSFARRHPKMSAGIAGALVIAGGVGAWQLIPTRHERLMEWRSDYMDHCFTRNEQEKQLKSREVAARLYGADDALEKMPPFGWEASMDFNADINHQVYCFGDTEEGKPPVQHWTIGGINIIDNDYPDAKLVDSYLLRELDGYWNNTVDYMDGFWGTNMPRYVAESAIMLRRFQMGVYVAEHVDMMYHLQRQFNDNVFASPYWSDLKRDGYYGSIVQAYEVSWAQFDGVADAVTDPRVMKAAMLALMRDPAKTNGDDARFLDNYADYMRDEDYVCEGTGEYDEDGDEIEECDWVYSSPSWYIHSVHLDPQTVVDLSALVRNGENPFLTYDDVQSIMNDGRYRQLGANAQWSWNGAKRLINEWCYWHDKGEIGANNLTIDYDASARYYAEAMKKEPIDDGFIAVPGF